MEEDAVFHEEDERRPPPSAQTVGLSAVLRRSPQANATTPNRSNNGDEVRHDGMAVQRGLVLAEESVDVEGVGGLMDLLIANSRDKSSGEVCGANTQEKSSI